jgi:hypothetical protein
MVGLLSIKFGVEAQNDVIAETPFKLQCTLSFKIILLRVSASDCCSGLTCLLLTQLKSSRHRALNYHVFVIDQTDIYYIIYC